MEQLEVATAKNLKIRSANKEDGLMIKNLLIGNEKTTVKKYHPGVYAASADALDADMEFFIDIKSFGIEAKTDYHAQAPEFFVVKNHTEVESSDRNFKKISYNKNYILLGDLTIKGLSRQVTLEVAFDGIMKDPEGQSAIFLVCGKINRRDFGPGWENLLTANDLWCYDELWISCEVHLPKHPHLSYYYSLFYALHSSRLNYIDEHNPVFKGLI